MPMIHISMYPGRTDDQKKALVREVTDAFVNTCGGEREGVWVILNEVPRDRWSVGGVLRSEGQPPG